MAAAEPPARLRYLVCNALGEPVATILDSGHGWLDIEINRPPRTAFPTDHPDPNAPPFAGVLSALRGSAPGWAVVKQTPCQVCGQWVAAEVGCQSPEWRCPHCGGAAAG